MRRAIELLDYWHREAKAQKGEPEERAGEWELDEHEAEKQFNSAATQYLGPAEMGIPEEGRDMIRWAEEMKLKIKGANG